VAETSFEEKRGGAATWERWWCDGLTGGGAEHDRAVRPARTAETTQLWTAEAALSGNL
jgi:hypothetical protein